MSIHTAATSLTLTLALLFAPSALAGSTTHGQMISPLHFQVGDSTLPTPDERLIPADQLAEQLQMALAYSSEPLDWMESSRRAVMHLRAWPDARLRVQAAGEMLDTIREHPQLFNYTTESIFDWRSGAVFDTSPNVIGPALPIEFSNYARRHLTLGWTKTLLSRAGIKAKRCTVPEAGKRNSFERAARAKAMAEIPFAQALLATDVKTRDQHLRAALALAGPDSPLNERMAIAYGEAHLSWLRDSAMKQPEMKQKQGKSCQSAASCGDEWSWFETPVWMPKLGCEAKSSAAKSSQQKACDYGKARSCGDAVKSSKKACGYDNAKSCGDAVKSSKQGKTCKDKRSCDDPYTLEWRWLDLPSWLPEPAKEKACGK